MYLFTNMDLYGIKNIVLRGSKMRKQYRYNDYTFGKKRLYIYHDGKLVETKELWVDEFLDEQERLEDEGYTYGFLDGEVEEEKQRYEHMLANMIEVNDNI